MTTQRFFTQLSILTAVTAAGLFVLSQAPALQEHRLISWLGLAFFVLLSIAMFFVGRRSALSDNKNTFTNVVMGFTMVKMLVAAVLILAYWKLAQPPDKLFLLPFFGLYVVYTAYETYFMMKLGKTNL